VASGTGYSGGGGFAVINFEKEGQYLIPYDGIWWHEEAGGVVAKLVDAGGPGDKPASRL